MELNESLLDKSFETMVKILPMPDMAEDAIIALKDFLTENEVKEWIKDFFNKVLNKDGHILSNISKVKETSKEKGISEGLSKAIDIVLNNAEKSKIIDKNTKNLINDSKDLIVNKIDKEKNNINGYNGQEEILNVINNKYNQWEECLNKLDTKNMIKLQNEIMKEYSKLNPTVELLNKINEMSNFYELAKSKVKNGENIITDLEKEICRKVG